MIEAKELHNSENMTVRKVSASVKVNYCANMLISFCIIYTIPMFDVITTPPICDITIHNTLLRIFNHSENNLYLN